MTQLLPPSEQVENVSQFFQIHPENPQARLIKQAVEIIRKGGVVIYPTDSSYAIGCQIATRWLWSACDVCAGWMKSTISR